MESVSANLRIGGDEYGSGEKEVYSSLTDLNGVDLFTDEYIAAVKNSNIEEADKFKFYHDNVFLLKDGKTEEKYEYVKSRMFSGTEPRILVRSEKPPHSFFTELVLAVIILCLGMISILNMTSKKKRTGS